MEPTRRTFMGILGGLFAAILPPVVVISVKPVVVESDDFISVTAKGFTVNVVRLRKRGEIYHDPNGSHYAWFNDDEWMFLAQHHHLIRGNEREYVEQEAIRIMSDMLQYEELVASHTAKCIAERELLA